MNFLKLKKFYREAHVVGTSFVQKLSLTATRTPSSGSFFPALILADDSSAFRFACSSVSVMKALNFLLNDFSLGKTSETSSMGHKSLSSSFEEI